MVRKFFGGVHPKGYKALTSQQAVQAFPEPDLLVIPMSQHIGAPCQPLVKKGDTVTVGQKIGDNQGLCVPVHASVSGTVKAVEKRPHTSGTMMMSVVIQNDHRQTLCPDIQPRTAEEVKALTAEQLIGIIREAGIVGMGGATFPTHVKLSGAIGKVDTVIVNAGECEPYITADDRLCREMPEKLVSGLQIIMQILGLNHAHIGIEDNKPEAIEALRRVLDPAGGIYLEVLPAMYPQGSEKQLIQALTGRQVPSGKLPVSVGCAVFNVASFAAMYRAVYWGVPLTQRIVTVSGETVNKPQNFIVRLGTPFKDLIEAAGGLTDATERVVSGGPMMGIAQSDLSVPVVKATNAILCLPHDENGAAENPVCLRCGKCVGVCPMGLQPLYIYRYAACDNVKELKRLHLMDCMECGCCAFTCPGKLPLVEQIRKGKAMLREEKK